MTIDRPHKNRSRRLGRKFLFMLLGTIILALALLQYDGRLFIDYRFRNSRVLGKSPNEIVRMYGPPVVDSRVDNPSLDNFDFFYFSGFQTIMIHFQHGKAVKTEYGPK